MTTSAVMQSILASPLTRMANASARVNQFLPTSSVPRLPRNSSVRVRSMAKVSTKFSDLFAFGGPTPERINGRLAMVGFVAAMAVELSRGQDLSVQKSKSYGLNQVRLSGALGRTGVCHCGSLEKVQG
ncbi:early light-induced protein, chloroplastic-like [Alnus glutinosa]|uniref:early light-induced protein, chloroplastic-like n=1 Tax=Alnus glutinosa TaxID=3517 RepID=UPI002D7736C5|nr:early light-induced protein, chloroplastic-like [Alnus glutinosa]